MKYAYYNSCSLRTTGKEYDRSLRAVCEKAGIELVELENWNCCGATLAHHISRLLHIALPMKNLAEVEKLGLKEVIVPCTACFSRFKFAQHEIADNPELAAEIEDIIEHKFESEIKVYHPLEVFSRDDVLSKLAGLVKRELKDLKVACYYGCYLLRPPKIMEFDVCEYPQSMDKVLKAVGIYTLDWSCKTDCCGGSFSVTRPEVVLKLTNNILEGAKAAGANAIAVPCTFCHLNLDTRQQEIEKKYQVNYDLPIFYFTQLVGLALGIPDEELLLKMHFVDTKRVLQGVS